MSVLGYPADKSIFLLQLKIRLTEVTKRQLAVWHVHAETDEDGVPLAGVLQDAVGRAVCCLFAVFGRAFFRHDRRTAPKFGTHVRIETRLALTKKKLTNPTPEEFRGLFIDGCGMWDVCGMIQAGGR